MNIIFLGFIGVTILWLGKVWCKEPEYAIPIGIFITTECFFLLTIANALQYQVVMIVILCVFFVAHILTTRKKRGLLKLDIKKWLFNILFLLAAFIYLSYYFDGYKVITNGDTNYYSTVTRCLYYGKSLSDTLPVLRFFTEYVPGIGIWKYVFIECMGKYDDSYLFIAYAMLLYISLLPFVNKMKWHNYKDSLMSALCFLTMLILPWSVTQNTLYVNTAVDVATGFLYVYTLAMSLREIQMSDKAWNMGVIVSVNMLILSKTMAILFGIICLICFLIKYYYSRTVTMRSRKQCAIIGIASFSSVFCWMFYCRIIANFEKYSASPLYNKTFPSYTVWTIKRYIKMLFTEPLNTYRGLSVAMVLVGSCICVLIACRGKVGTIKREKVLYGIVYLGGTGCFMLGHLWTYLFKFSENETMIMSSYARYLAPCFLPLILYMVYAWTADNRLILCSVIICCALILQVDWNRLAACWDYDQYCRVYEQELKYKKEAERIEEYLEQYYFPGDVLGIVYTDAPYFQFLGDLRYEMAPKYFIESTCNSLDEVRFWADVYGWDKFYVQSFPNEELTSGGWYEVVREDGKIQNLALLEYR